MPRRPKVEASEIRGPRKYLRYPEQFGVVPKAEPAPLRVSQQYRATAALAQHELAREVAEQMPRLETTYAELAETIGVSVEQLRRMLRGESTMSIERMHHLAQATALRLTTTIERIE